MRPYNNAYDILFLSRYKVVYNQGRSYLYGTPPVKKFLAMPLVIFWTNISVKFNCDSSLF